MLNKNKVMEFVNNYWDKNGIAALSKYVSIPCKTPGCEPDWDKKGHLLQAIECVVEWVRAQGLADVKTEVIKLEGKTPFLYIDIPSSGSKTKNTVLFYGHLDKMPEAGEWESGLGAWNPVIRDNRLYGRGAVDNGYATFAAIGALKAMQAQNLPCPRCIFLLETIEESGSADFPHYLNAVRDRIGDKVSLIVSLDSTAESYDRLWCTTSFRGHLVGNLSIEILKKTVHSGSAGGMIPTTFTVMRQLLERLEDIQTGKIIPADFYVAVSQKCKAEIKDAAKTLGDKVRSTLPLVEGAKTLLNSNEELLFSNCWEPSLAVLGADGLPPTASAGNNIWASLNLKLAMRTPPSLPAETAFKKFKQILEQDPPFGAKVTFNKIMYVDGLYKGVESAWLQKALAEASKEFFGKEPIYLGIGAGIPPLKMLDDVFPKAEMIVTGLLGINANVHGPNEFLDIPAAKKMTCCVANILTEFCKA